MGSKTVGYTLDLPALGYQPFLPARFLDQSIANADTELFPCIPARLLPSCGPSAFPL